MSSPSFNAYPPVSTDSSWVADGALAQASYQGALARAESRGKAPVKILDQKHPDYVLKAPAWLDLTLLKESGVAIGRKCERLLQKRPREDPEVYNGRMERFTHQPILGTALGWYEAAMYKEEPQFFFYKGTNKTQPLDTKESSYYKDQFLSNCDGNRTQFVDFSKRAFADLLTYGVAHILTDLPPRDPSKPELTLQQELDGGYRDPFLVCYTPLEVINWRTDRTGAYEWVVIKTSKLDQQFLSKPQEVDTWYYFDRTSYKCYELRRDAGTVAVNTDSSTMQADLIAEGTHALSHVSRVPLRSFYLSNKLWLANRAYLLLRDHLNQDNSLAWALFISNLAIPIIIGDVDTTNMVDSETGFFQFPAGTEYKWSEPEGRSFAVSMNRLEGLREEAFRCMYLQSQGMSMRATPQMQSGRSKLVSMVPTHEVLSNMAKDLRQRLQELLGDVVDARRDAIYPDVRGFDYDDDMTTEEVFAVSSVLGLRIPSESFEKWIYKKVVKAWARDVNQASLEKMYQEIDEGPTMEQKMDEDLKVRMSLMQKGMGKAVSGKMGPQIPMPPGRGGAGPTPPVNGTDDSAAGI